MNNTNILYFGKRSFNDKKRNKSSNLIGSIYDDDDTPRSKTYILKEDPSKKQMDIEDQSIDHLSTVHFNDHLVGECYIGFSKLLQSELRKFEKRDS
jgi:hypothetical protein